MTFLKKLGTVVLKIIGVATGVIPLIQGAFPQATPTTTAIKDKLNEALNVIVTVEQAFTAAFGPDAKKGSDKLNAAKPFIAQLLQQSELLIGKHPKDEAAFELAVTNITSSLANVLNAYGD